MEGAKDNGVSPPGERFRWMFVFAIGGDLRFISHHDTLRLFRRALARAGIPVRYSGGFNPHPRMMIPLPRPVGIASRAEVLVIETEHDLAPEEALHRLQEHTPEDVHMMSARRLLAGERLEPATVRYRLGLDQGDPQDLEARLNRLLSAASFPIRRSIPKTKSIRDIDIRPFLLDARKSNDAIEFTLKMTGSGAARPAEIAEAIGFDAGSINHRIERLEVQWRQTQPQN